jgi:hypothetical protein
VPEGRLVSAIWGEGIAIVVETVAQLWLRLASLLVGVGIFVAVGIAIGVGVEIGVTVSVRVAVAVTVDPIRYAGEPLGVESRIAEALGCPLVVL